MYYNGAGAKKEKGIFYEDSKSGFRADLIAIMITTWLSGVIENGEKVMVWPEVGFVLTAIMIVLTVLNAIKNKDSQAY